MAAVMKKEGSIEHGQMLFRCRKCGTTIWAPINVPIVRANLDAAGWKPRLLLEGWHCASCAKNEEQAASGETTPGENPGEGGEENNDA